VAGVVLVRQRPGNGNAIFLTLEDETGIANVVLWPNVFEAFRPVVMGARLMLVRGKVQRADGVVHLLGEELEDLSGELARLSEPPVRPRSQLTRAADAATGSGDSREVRHRHPRDVRVLPRSRDFH
jgi:error-prone DNA polymerase